MKIPSSPPLWLKVILDSPKLTDGDLYHLWHEGLIDCEIYEEKLTELREFTLKAPLAFFDDKTGERLCFGIKKDSEDG